MIISVNGKEEHLDESMTVAAFIGSRNLNPDIIVIEHNEMILKKNCWDKITLRENDKLEIVAFVGGG